MATNTDDGYIRITADISECLAFFDGLEVNKDAIRANILRRVGTGGKQAVKRTFGSYLHKRSGELYRTIKSVLPKKGKSKAVVITNSATSDKPTSKDGRNARYGFMLASGYTIQGKNGGLLTFNIDGHWYRKHSVTVRPVDWVEPTVEKYTNSADCHQRLEAEFQRQIDYWDKRISGEKK